MNCDFRAVSQGSWPHFFLLFCHFPASAVIPWFLTCPLSDFERVVLQFILNVSSLASSVLKHVSESFARAPLYTVLEEVSTGLSSTCARRQQTQQMQPKNVAVAQPCWNRLFTGLSLETSMHVSERLLFSHQKLLSSHISFCRLALQVSPPAEALINLLGASSYWQHWEH